MLFKNSKFLLLWGSQFCSQFADRFFLYWAVISIYKVTGTNFGVSTAAFAFGLPALIIGPFVGTWIERWSKKYTLIIVNFFRALVLFVVSLSLAHMGWYQILLACVAISFFSQFFIPAETTSIVRLVDKKNLLSANTVFICTFLGSGIVAFGVAAPIAVNYLDCIILTGVCLFLIATLAVLLIKYPKEVHHEHQHEPVYKSLIKGWLLCYRNQILRVSLIQTFLTSMIFTIISILGITFAERVLDLTAELFGIMIVIAGVGLSIGLVVLHALHSESKGKAITLGVFISALALIGFSFSTTLMVASFFLFIAGFGMAFIMIPTQTILQEKPPHRFHGRVMGMQNLALNAAIAFPPIIFGKLGDIWGIQQTFCLVAALLLLNGFFLLTKPKFLKAR